jgi:hypothetical protein
VFPLSKGDAADGGRGIKKGRRQKSGYGRQKLKTRGGRDILKPFQKGDFYGDYYT